MISRPFSALGPLDDVADLEEVDGADLLVVLRLELAVHAEDLLRRGQDRLLERLQEDLDVDPLVLAHLLEHHRQIRLHLPSFTLELVNQIRFFHVVDGHLAHLVADVDLHLAASTTRRASRRSCVAIRPRDGLVRIFAFLPTKRAKSASFLQRAVEPGRRDLEAVVRPG